MKKFFLPIFAVLLVLGSILPLAAYRVTRAVLSGAEPASSAVSSPAASAQPPSAVPSADAETFLVEDQATGQVLELSRQEYVLGAVAAEMPVSWPDEALKAQAVAAHSYALYCRDHTTLHSGAWRTADPARRQGCLTEPVLRSYWGTAYEQNYARLSALVDEVLDEILYYENAPACASYFAISNGQTEASENVWGSALPYLISVDSRTDRSADNYEYTVTFSAEQVQQALAGLGISAALAAPAGWFGPAALTSAGFTKPVTVCGQTVTGTTLRRALRKRSISADSALISRLRRQLLPMEKPLDAYRQEAYAASAPFSRMLVRFLTVASSKPGTLVRSWPHICSLVMTAWTSVGTSSFLCSL